MLTFVFFGFKVVCLGGFFFLEIGHGDTWVIYGTFMGEIWEKGGRKIFYFLSERIFLWGFQNVK